MNDVVWAAVVVVLLMWLCFWLTDTKPRDFLEKKPWDKS
jgi:hypothetical protein